MTLYARVNDDNTIDFPYRVPAIYKERWDLRSLRPDVLNPHGIFAVVEVPKPADTPSTTHDRGVQEVDGVPTYVWTPRQKTQGELDADIARAARDDREFNLGQAITTLRSWSGQAEGVTVTNQNATQVLQTMVNRTAIFYNQFADLLEDRFS